MESFAFFLLNFIKKIIFSIENFFVDLGNSWNNISYEETKKSLFPCEKLSKLRKCLFLVNF